MDNFIKKVDKYYQQQKKKKIIDLDKNYIVRTYTTDSNEHIIELIDKENVIFRAEYELIGMFNMTSSIWYWAWDIDLIDRSLVTISEKMRNFPQYIKENLNLFTDQESDDLFFRTIMANYYTNQTNIEQLMKISIYHLNAQWYIPVYHNNTNNTKTTKLITKTPLRIEYILIKKILNYG